MNSSKTVEQRLKFLEDAVICRETMDRIVIEELCEEVRRIRRACFWAYAPLVVFWLVALAHQQGWIR